MAVPGGLSWVSLQHPEPPAGSRAFRPARSCPPSAPAHRTLQNYLVWRLVLDRISSLSQRFKDVRADYRKVRETPQPCPPACCTHSLTLSPTAVLRAMPAEGGGPQTGDLRLQNQQVCREGRAEGRADLSLGVTLETLRQGDTDVKALGLIPRVQKQLAHRFQGRAP